VIIRATPAAVMLLTTKQSEAASSVFPKPAIHRLSAAATHKQGWFKDQLSDHTMTKAQ